jgi:hypothetical protein
MSDRDYNKLEARFKELSENTKFDYQADDWTAVQKMLDEDKKDRTGLWFILPGFLVMSGVVAWFFLSDFNTKDGTGMNQYHTIEANESNFLSVGNTTTDRSGNQIDVRESQSELNEDTNQTPPAKTVKAETASSSVSGEQKDIVPLSESKTQYSVAATRQNDSSNTQNDQEVRRYDSSNSGEVINAVRLHTNNPLPSDQSSIVGPETEDQVADRSDDQFSDRDRVIQNNSQEIIEEPLDLVSAYDVSSSRDEAKSLPLTQNAISDLAVIMIAPLNLDKINYDGVKPFEHSADDDDADDLEKSPKFLLNLNVGIEIAQTPMGGLSDVDYSFGARLGYIANSKLVINAGLNYIRECYLAEGDDYRPPVGFWAASEGVPPEEILALCDMIDVSIGASYHFSDVQSNGIVAHVNLLSNFMLREEYDYRFAESSDDFTGLFLGDSNTLLSQIELSTAYKLRTKGGFFIDAGPYLKVPLNGVGHGDVKLTSVGFRIGISLVR